MEPFFCLPRQDTFTTLGEALKQQTATSSLSEKLEALRPCHLWSAFPELRVAKLLGSARVAPCHSLTSRNLLGESLDRRILAPESR